MKFIKKDFDTDKGFAHALFFQLSDTSRELQNGFLELCIRHLSHHPGQRHFSIGYRALELDKEVNGELYDVSVDIIFDNVAAFEKYSASKNYETFITESAGMFLGRVAYDSHVQVLIVPETA